MSLPRPPSTPPARPDIAESEMYAALAAQIQSTEPKSWWRSRGVVGALMVIVAQGASLLGLELDAGLLTEMAMQLVSLAGGVLALWGRVRAVRPIATGARD